jgi:hypothetical protein
MEDPHDDASRDAGGTGWNPRRPAGKTGGNALSGYTVTARVRDRTNIDSSRYDVSG